MAERSEEVVLDRIPVVLDTDGGIDDCTALWYVLGEPRLELVAVTTVRGVVDAGQAARNVAKVLHAAGRHDVPVAVGADEPFGPVPRLPGRGALHGDDGLGDTGIPDAPLAPVGEPAADLLARVAAGRPGEVTLVAVGPFTNVAVALAADPAWATGLRDLVVMGGVAESPGATDGGTEFNAAFDPSATAVMVEAAWPRPPLTVGLDVTCRATITAAELALAAEGRTAAARFLEKPLAHRASFHTSSEPSGGAPSHDTLAAMAVAHPDVVDTEVLPLLAGAAPWRVAVEVDVAAFRARVRRMLGG